MTKQKQWMTGFITAVTLVTGLAGASVADETKSGQTKSDKMKSEKMMKEGKLTPAFLKTRMEGFYKDVVNGKDLAKVNEYVATDFKEHTPMPGMKATSGSEAVRESIAALLTAFPDLKMEVKSTVAEGNNVVARIQMTGTQRGEFMGIQPTGKKVDIQVMDWVSANEKGQATEHWGLMDTSKLMQQLGQTPPGKQAQAR